MNEMEVVVDMFSTGMDSAKADLLSENSVGWREVQTEKFFRERAQPHTPRQS